MRKRMEIANRLLIAVSQQLRVTQRVEEVYVTRSSIVLDIRSVIGPLVNVTYHAPNDIRMVWFTGGEALYERLNANLTAGSYGDEVEEDDA